MQCDDVSTSVCTRNTSTSATLSLIFSHNVNRRDFGPHSQPLLNCTGCSWFTAACHLQGIYKLGPLLLLACITRPHFFTRAVAPFDTDVNQPLLVLRTGRSCSQNCSSQVTELKAWSSLCEGGYCNMQGKMGLRLICHLYFFLVSVFSCFFFVCFFHCCSHLHYERKTSLHGRLYKLCCCS